MDKVEIARRQLGVALALFIRDQDPVSVQCLACGGCEIVERIAEHRGLESFTNHLLKQRQELTLRKFRELRSVYWNSFKHVNELRSDTIRDDTKLIEQFSDDKNDEPLLIGWSDYAVLTEKMPIAAQVFQVWYFALNLGQLAPEVDQRPFHHYFPDLVLATRREQKRRLKRSVEKYEHDKNHLSQPGTESGPLIFRA